MISKSFTFNSNEILKNLHDYCMFINKSDMFTIKINEKEVVLPLEISISLSTKILDLLRNDPLIRQFCIKMEFKDPNSTEIIAEILSHYCTEIDSSKLINNAIIYDLADFGFYFGNSMFIEPLENSAQLPGIGNIQEILSRIHYKLLLAKYKIQSKDENLNNFNIDYELNYISDNFQKIYTNKDFKEWCKDISNLPFLEKIFSNESFQKNTEDSLLLFILDLCKSNQGFLPLLSYVYLEYCSIEQVKKFIDFVDDCFKSFNMPHSGNYILSCLKRRCIHPVSDIKQGNRHSNNNDNSNVYNYDENDPINGILYHENQMNNVLITPSSVGRDGDQYNVYNLVKKPYKGQRTCFYSEDSSESSITFSLKDKKPFIINGYTIRGNWNNNSFKMKSWVILGQSAISKDWIEIDKKENQEKFLPLEFKHFQVKTTPPLVAVQLKQIDKTYDNTNKLVISAFEIYGNTVNY